MTYFCPRCMTADVKLRTKYSVIEHKFTDWVCNRCDQQFTTFEDGKSLSEADKGTTR